MLTQSQLVLSLAKVNIEALARESGVSAKTIHRIKTKPGYSPTMGTAEKLADALVRLATSQHKAA